jgi:hypothetical protein
MVFLQLLDRSDPTSVESGATGVQEQVSPAV